MHSFIDIMPHACRPEQLHCALAATGMAVISAGAPGTHLSPELTAHLISTLPYLNIDYLPGHDAPLSMIVQ
jgi:hypothetical protein